MSQVFDENGAAIPVTVVEAGPCPILQKRIPEKDGYSAIQIGFGKCKEKNVAKPMLGHFKKAGTDPMAFIREIRLDDTNGYEVGQTLNVELFEAGEQVDISGISKGRGFSGTVRRYNTGRGPSSHGSHYHRRPGSSGQSSDPSRVYKGKVNPGQYGNEKVTVQNLTVIGTEPEKNLLIIKGSIPGSRNGYVIIRKCKKAKKGSK